MIKILYQDGTGRLWMPEDIDEFQPREVEEKGIHVVENMDSY